MKTKLLNIVRCAAILAAMVLYIMTDIVYEKTLVAWWIPTAITTCAALGTILLLGKRWKWLTGTEDKWVNAACNAYMIGAITAGTMMIGNYYTTGNDSYIMEVCVEKKNMIKKNVTQRIGKHRYRKSGVKYEYYLDVLTEDSMRKSIPVSRTVYNRIRYGGQAELHMQRGCIGLPVVKDITRKNL